jgi:6-phosphogluconolactonase
VNLRRFDGPAAAAAALAAQVATALRLGLSLRGTASLAVAGGRTPVPMFQVLRDAELDWNRVQVTLTDERWVPQDDPASNAALVRRELLAGAAAAARFVPLHDGTARAADAVAAIWNNLRAVARPFDAVVLGMGEDGHFASLFAGNDGLAAALDPGAAPACVAMRAPVAPAERISLNLAALLQARRLFLLITGTAKRELLQAAVRRDARQSCPVSALFAPGLPQQPEVYWAP